MHDVLNYWGYLTGHEVAECARCHVILHHPRCVTCRSGSKPMNTQDSAVLVFPCAGPKKSWVLTPEQIAFWKASFPGVDILSECRQAHAWVMASPSNMKTAKGMGRFLVAWLGRAQNRLQQYRHLDPGVTINEPAWKILQREKAKHEAAARVAATDAKVRELREAQERLAHEDVIGRLRKERGE